MFVYVWFCKFYKAFIASSISSIGTLPPHILNTYSGVTRAGSIEQERASSSMNSRRRATNSGFIYFFHKFLIYIFKTSSGPMGS